MTNAQIQKFIAELQEINLLVSAEWSANKQNVGDLIETILIAGYLSGREAAEGYLDYVIDTGADLAALDGSLNKVIAGKTYKERINDYLENNGSVDEVIRVAETEYHRMYNDGIIDGANEIGYRTGEYITKTWVTAGDDKVRDTHEYLEGMTIPLNDMFYTFDGDSAYAPGGFSKAENDVNCRCTLLLGH